MLQILYQDKVLVLCVKPAGIPSQGTPNGGADMLSLLRAQLGGEIYPVHRLDQGVGGCMVFARTGAAAGQLSTLMQSRDFTKEYLAMVQGVPVEEGVLRDLLFHDKLKNKTYIATQPRSGAKEEALIYRALSTMETVAGTRTLVQVRLLTGRTHQIRAQFSSRGFPLAGDRKYGGSGEESIALWSYRLAFAHPASGKQVEARCLPEGGAWTPFALEHMAFAENLNTIKE